jgi:hypothetical protein
MAGKQPLVPVRWNEGFRSDLNQSTKLTVFLVWNDFADDILVICYGRIYHILLAMFFQEISKINA